MLWRMLLAEGISIAAFVDNPVGGKPIIAGMNVLGIGYKDFDPLTKFTVSSQHLYCNANVLTVIRFLNYHFFSCRNFSLIYNNYIIKK